MKNIKKINFYFFLNYRESAVPTHRLLELNKIGSTKLDPKYFQNHSPQSVGSPTNFVESLNQIQPVSGLIGQKSSLPSTVQSNNIGSVRINKQLTSQPSQQPQQLVNSSSNAVSTKSTPSLASAYFPSS